jgi:predicted HTH domain antitoxin
MNGVGVEQMVNAAKEKQIEIRDDAELGLAMLIAEFSDGNYQPVAAVVSINEAREIAESNLRARMKELERGGEPACPERYVAWAQGTDGSYREVKEIMP